MDRPTLERVVSQLLADGEMKAEVALSPGTTAAEPGAAPDRGGM